MSASPTAAEVKQLRDATGAGMMDCKKALIEADGDFERASSSCARRASPRSPSARAASANQGLVDAYVHFNNTVGVLVEVNCETDFVANTDDFQRLVKDIALHIASPSAPRFLTPRRGARRPSSTGSGTSPRCRPRRPASPRT